MNTVGNTIFITGGSSGIGKALAHRWHDLGNTVIVAGRRCSALQETIEGRPSMAFYELDITDPDAIATVARRLIAEHPDLNVLVNCAGISGVEDPTIAGETPISTADHLDPTLDATLRDRAILVIEEPLIASAPRDWTETLRDQCWTGFVIIIAHTLHESVPENEGVALVDRHSAPAAIPPIIQRWRSQPAL
jgi:NAD(P)-dependent dehydrogenase (short-subunit alcohol dehydrogenase family)